jgi:hypothetical protein
MVRMVPSVSSVSSYREESVNDPLITHFEKIGARLNITHHPWMRRAFDLNIVRDKKRGEVFTLAVRDNTDGFRVLQANAAARHLLLLAPTETDDRADSANERNSPKPMKRLGPVASTRLLCGHDERHWLVAAVRDRVSTISEAKRSLLPDPLKDVSAAQLHSRRNARFKRQGEWIFVEAGSEFDLSVSLKNMPILHGEPLRRGTGSQPHMMAKAIRFGGVPVVLCYGREYSVGEWDTLVKRDASWAAKRHERAFKDPEVFARGAIRHADHATLVLDTWHRVFLNNEARAAGVSFYD